MKSFTIKKLGIALAGVLALIVTSASADIGYQFVTVGNPGNADDTTGFGGVDYTYNIGKYEVTLNQYTTFLNAVAATDTYNLYRGTLAGSAYAAGIAQNGASGSFSYSVIGDGNRPVAYVSWLGAARFTNWLSNGQPFGLQTAATTEDGVYTLNGANSPFSLVSRNANAQYSIPTENEWYKAAYYDPSLNSGAGGYWQYPTRSNSVPGNVVGNGTNMANAFYNDLYCVTQSSNLTNTNYLTPVGAFTNSASAYGTFDQGGNVWEWNDSVFDIINPDTGDLDGYARGLRGDAWNSPPNYIMSSSFQYSNDQTAGYGFRVAGAVPEPSAALLLIGSALPLLLRRRRAAFITPASPKQDRQNL